MKRTALVAVVLLALTACSSTDAGDITTTTVPEPLTTEAPVTTTTIDTSTTLEAAFPVTVTDDVGPVTIEVRPEAIVSLSATATEMLFEIGAGPQVVAVDDQSNHPPEAPMTELSGFTPNLEAILSYDPDLVVISFDPADNSLSEGLAQVGIPTLLLGAGSTIDDVYRQVEVLGEATGNLEAAQAVSADIRSEMDEIVEQVGGTAEGVTYYHELDANLFSIASSTFIGEVYGLLGLINIADDADLDGSGYPQLSSEFVVEADPDIIFLANAGFGESAETLAERPGWSGMAALERGAVVELDGDIASRWGPRIVDFLRVVADAVTEFAPEGEPTG